MGELHSRSYPDRKNHQSWAISVLAPVEYVQYAINL